MTIAEKVVTWSRRLLLTGGVQTAIQLLAFASGLLVIRHLSAEQYVYYTIANAALGTMTVLTDSGINNGVLAQAGLAMRDRTRLGVVLVSGLAIRRRLSVAAVILCVPLMLALLHHQGARWSTATCIAASILPAYFATVSGHLFEAIPRLQQRLLPLQTIQLGSGLLRLLTVALAVPRWPLAWIATVVMAIPQWIANWNLRRLAGLDAERGVRSDADVCRQLLWQVRRSMPGAVYYSFSGQLTIWLISAFGRSSAVAAVGALSRLAMLLSVFTSVFAVLAIPRFARLPNCETGLIVRRFWQFLAAIAAACLVPIALLAALPDMALAVLGSQYQGLASEAILMALSSLVAVMTGAAFSLGAARGIVAPPLLAIPVFVAIQVVLIAALPIHTVGGVIAVGLLSGIGQCGFHCGYFCWHMHRIHSAAATVSRV